ncbi:MAG: quinone oxidoreductase family protein [Bacilli bacterium]
MKAIQIVSFGGPEVMRLVDVPVPVVAENEVLVRVVKTSVNFADVKARYGKKGKGTFPMGLGLDAAGEVVAIGRAVRDIRVGDRVICFPKGGSYAEVVVAKETLTFPIPDALGWEAAAACPVVGFLSMMLLGSVGKLEQGETVVVHAAAGGVGTTLVQLAKSMGASHVIGVVGAESKFDTVKLAGADWVTTYADFVSLTHEVTDGRGADLILDSVSGEVFEQSLTCLASYGRLVHFGNSGGRAGVVRSNELHNSCRSVLGFSLGNTRKQRPAMLHDVAPKLFQSLVSGDLKITVGHTFALGEVAEAHALMERRESVGKILLDV